MEGRAFANEYGSQTVTGLADRANRGGARNFFFSNLFYARYEENRQSKTGPASPLLFSLYCRKYLEMSLARWYNDVKRIVLPSIS